MQLKNINQTVILALIFTSLFFQFGCGKKYYSLVKVTNNNGSPVENISVNITGKETLVISRKEGNVTYFEFEIQDEGSLVIRTGSPRVS